MKKMILLALCFSCSFYSFSQIPIQLKTGIFVNKNIGKNPMNDEANFATSLFENKYYLWLQFNELPTEIEKARLIATGIEFFDYLPTNTFIASFPKTYNFNLLAQFKVNGIIVPPVSSKIDPTLSDPSSISWAFQNPDIFSVNITFNPKVSKFRIQELITVIGAKYQLLPSILNDVVSMKISYADVLKIAQLPIIQYVEPISPNPTLEDNQGISNHRNNSTNTTDNFLTGEKLDGSGVAILIGDDGFIGPHIDFQGRLTNYANNMTAGDTHGDHCSGIIAGASNFSPRVRGQAPGATLYSYDYYNDYSNYPALYATDSVRVTSHSLGQTCNAGYSTDARTSDILLRDNFLMNHVHSSGNSGNTTCGGLSGGWKTITGGFKAGKNVITVGNVLKTDALSSSSSKGPTADRRIKPDIVAVGTSVTSTQPNNTYTSLSGTSMACPAIAGNMAVLTQAYKKSFLNVEPDGALIKVIALNTADDLGNIGPDFSFGWGRINMRRAVSCIKNTRFFSGNISQSGLNEHQITIPANVKVAKVMIYWNDAPANAASSQALVNNINCTMVDLNANVYQPWQLDPGTLPTASTCQEPAVRGDENLNNVEQIQIDAPVAGAYTLKVNGTTIPVANQKYYVVFEFLMNNEVVVTSPFGGETFVPGETERIRWDANNDEFDVAIVEYSSDGGTSWQLLNNSVPGTIKYFDWVVPSSVTKLGRIRVSINGIYSDVSDTNFIILPVPTGLAFTEVCQGRTTVSWNGVVGATGYDVFMLGDKQMTQIASSNTNSVTISNLAVFTENWFAVRAKLGTSQANGRRTTAVMHMNTSSVSCPPLPVKLIYFKGVLKNNIPVLNWQVASEINIKNYIVERADHPSFENPITIGSAKPFNQFEAIQNYTIEDRSISTKGIYYYRLKIVEADKAIFSNIQMISLNKENLAVNIFPNPTKSNLFITIQEKVENASIEIFSQDGKRVFVKQNINFEPNIGNNVNVSTLSNGNYFIKINDTKTNKNFVKQVFTVFK